MPLDSPTAEDRPFPALVDRDEPPQPRAKPSVPRIPVAKPAPARVSLKGEPGDAEPAPMADLLAPTSVKGWSISIACHAVFLLMLALWYFSPRLDGPKTLNAQLDAGSPFGDESGDSLKGGLGMDTPLAMPLGPAPALEAPPTQITTIPVADLNLKPSLSANAAGAANAASNGGGVNLSNPGMGGAGDGFGVAKYGHGGENVNGVAVKVGDPQFTLIWDSNKTDIDLHVMEPGGSHLFWEEKRGSQGGELDVDNTQGFGPENVYWGGGTGQGPEGEYKWYVHYYGVPHDAQARPIRWKVRVKHDGVVTVYTGKLNGIGEKSKTYSLKVETSAKKVEK